LWIYRKNDSGGTRIFFRLALCQESLANMIQTNFAMVQHHKYSLTELENMIPWEREIYVGLLIKYVAEENERRKQLQQQQRG